MLIKPLNQPIQSNTVEHPKQPIESEINVNKKRRFTKSIALALLKINSICRSSRLKLWWLDGGWRLAAGGSSRPSGSVCLTQYVRIAQSIGLFYMCGGWFVCLFVFFLLFLCDAQYIYRHRELLISYEWCRMVLDYITYDMWTNDWAILLLL